MRATIHDVARPAMRSLLCGTALAAFSIGIASAQTVPVPPVPVADDAQADVDSDIVVTAQRREERVQDIPLSVTALSGKTLLNAQVTTVERLEQLVPGVRMGRSGSDLRPAIRGTYTENVAVNGDPRIGIYIDDIYQSRTSQIPPIVDLARVEVQKGPQGTLYGRNSFGGNIAFNSALPTDRFEGGLDGIYGNYGRYRLDGFVNVPLTDGVALRVAGMREKQDGYIKNSNPAGNDAGDVDQWFVRGTLRVAPRAVEGLEIVLRGSYLDQGGAGQYGFGYKEVGVLVDRDLIRQPGQSLTRNGVTYALPNGFNGQSYTGTPLLVDSRYRDGIPDVNGVDVGIPVDADPYRINFAGSTLLDARQYAGSGHITYDLGPVTLRSITSYSDFENVRTGNSLTPVLLNYSYLATRAKTFTQELQVLSSDSASPFKYILGGYYYNDDVTERNVTNVNRSYVTATAPAGQQYYTFGFTALPTAAQGLNQTSAYDSFSAYRQRIKSYAAYGQLSYTIADKLTLTAGARYTRDDKTLLASVFNTTAAGGTGSSYYAHSINDPINYVCGGFIAANGASNASAATISTAYRFVCNSLSQDFVTYRGAIDYKFDRDHMIYASYSTGVHSGGFNTGAVTVAGVPTLLAFNPEKVTAYEVGSKNTFLDGQFTFNLAAYYNRYSNLQAQTSIPNPNNPLQSVIALVQNIGRDDAYGVDAEAVIRPVRGLSVNIAVNYLHARERDYAINLFNFGGAATFCNVTPSCTAASGEINTVQGTPFPNARTDPNRFVPLRGPDGNQIVIGGVPQFLYVIAGTGADGTKYVSRKAFSPDITIQAGVSYDIPLGAAGTLTPEVQTYFSGDYILTDITPGFGDQKAFTRTDLRLGWRSADARFRLQAFVNNLEDSAVITRAVYANNRTLQANYAIGRTYGISGGVRF
ncbi:TonB-dependent receptor [uncultured Sphingomonas sp.]|uniref:TonB-dependent receptor n=1 Tax=uncultured Sphingomonas sp. TaxID=158754 RepID=UPI0035C953CC